MNTLLLFLFVLGVEVLAYVLVYPKVVKNSIKRLLIADLVMTSTLLVAVAVNYWGTGVAFDFWLFSLNWFWATLLFAIVVESVLFPWYCKRFGIDLTALAGLPPDDRKE